MPMTVSSTGKRILAAMCGTWKVTGMRLFVEQKDTKAKKGQFCVLVRPDSIVAWCGSSGLERASTALKHLITGRIEDRRP
eukprot:jgi/Bigna1/134757/aug1.26_g9465